MKKLIFCDIQFKGLKLLVTAAHPSDSEFKPNYGHSDPLICHCFLFSSTHAIINLENLCKAELSQINKIHSPEIYFTG